MKFWHDFKTFAVKGNMIDLAIGVIIGTAFNNIVNTLVKNVITPPLGYLTGGVDVSDRKWVMREPELDAAGEVVDPGVIVEYGLFIEACIDFFIIAMTIFMVVRFLKSFREKAEDPANKEVPTPKDIQLLSEILDEMRKFNSRAEG